MKVGLIKGLWCFLEGYISKAPDPRRNPEFIQFIKREASDQAIEPPSQLDL
jgi:hypothetical protein